MYRRSCIRLQAFSVLSCVFVSGVSGPVPCVLNVLLTDILTVRCVGCVEARGGAEKILNPPLSTLCSRLPLWPRGSARVRVDVNATALARARAGCTVSLQN